MKRQRKPGYRTDPTGRSVGDWRHVRLHHWLLQGAAYRSLDCTARTLLVELYALFNGFNNGEVFMSAREAGRRLGVGKTKGWAALRALAERGFIRPRVAGTFQFKLRHATKWVLTEFDFAGQRATRDFMRWCPSPEIQKPVRPRGRSVRVGGQHDVEVAVGGAICPSPRTENPPLEASTVRPDGHR